MKALALWIPAAVAALFSHTLSMSATAAGGITWERTEQSIVAEPDQKPTKVIFRFTNTGEAPDDIDRRHVVQVSVDKPDMQVLTPGTTSVAACVAFLARNDSAAGAWRMCSSWL